MLEWCDQAMQTRLNDPKTGAFVLIMQRVHEADLTGHILSNDVGSEWEHLCLPARYEPDHPSISSGTASNVDPRSKRGELLWPDRVDEDTLNRLERSLGEYAAAGQLQQRPMPRGGTILKSDWWRPWDKKDLPDCDYVLQSWDTAYSEKERSSYSARTTWAVFQRDNAWNAIVIDCWYDRISYPDLRRGAQDA